MGVSLERVQFKFASIIGELCSEPDILSQFAVWVDLRLAEYKLKGSISLDCSGDLPDPVWLNGILSALLEKKLQKERQTTAHLLEKRKGLIIDKPLFHSTPIAGRTSDLRLRPQDNIDSTMFPLKAHTNRDSDRVHEFRKRRAPHTLTQFNSDAYNTQTPAKLRRKEGTEDDPITVAHESLMSIIGVNTMDSSAVKSEPANQDNGTDKLAPEIMGAKPEPEDPSILIIHGDDSQENSEMLNSGDQGQTLVDWKTVEQFERKRFRAIQTRSYVNKFEKWAKLNPRFDNRKMEDMPPEVLDPYLVDFLSTVTSNRTGAMGVNSLIALRSGLERHLKEVKYPFSIISSPLFLHSQLAYKTRKNELHANSTANSSAPFGYSCQSDELIPTELLSESI